MHGPPAAVMHWFVHQPQFVAIVPRHLLQRQGQGLAGIRAAQLRPWRQLPAAADARQKMAARWRWLIRGHQGDSNSHGVVEIFCFYWVCVGLLPACRILLRRRPASRPALRLPALIFQANLPVPIPGSTNSGQY